MITDKTRGGLFAGLAALLFAVLAVLNYISARHVFTRVDLTRDDQFTVAAASRRLLAELDDVVNVTAYLSRDLPEQAATIPAEVRDLLLELEAHAGGYFRVDYVDPTADAQTEARVRNLGIPKVPLMVVERNKQQTVEVYLGLTVGYGDQLDVIPTVLDGTNLEYEIMSAILRQTRPRKTVGFLTGHGEQDIYRDYALFADQVRRQHEVTVVDLGRGGVVPETVKTLVVAGPKEEVDDWSLYQIDQFLMRGGHALFLLDGFTVDPTQLGVAPVEHNLDEALASYGVRIEKSLVADWELNEVVRLPSDGPADGVQRPRVIAYPLWPKIAQQYMDSQHPLVSQLPSLVLPWTSPLSLTRDEGATVLASTTPYAIAERELFTAHPRSLTEPSQDQLMSFPVAAVITGPLTSHWAGREPPTRPTTAGDDRDGDGDDALAPAEREPEPAMLGSVATTQIVVVGGSQLAVNGLVQQPAYVANLVFVLNAVDWLTMGEELLGIRSRLDRPPLLDVDRIRLGYRLGPFFNIAVVPGLVVIFGLLWRAVRRSRRFALE